MTVTVLMKKQVIARDGGFCQLALRNCQGSAATTDHRANRGMGGDPQGILDHPANLVAACAFCNSAKEEATGIQRTLLTSRGFIIRRCSTNHETLTKAKNTPVESLDGRLWSLISATVRIPYRKIGDEQ